MSHEALLGGKRLILAYTHAADERLTIVNVLDMLISAALRCIYRFAKWTFESWVVSFNVLLQL